MVGGFGRREETVERNDAAGTSPPTFVITDLCTGLLDEEEIITDGWDINKTLTKALEFASDTFRGHEIEGEVRTESRLEPYHDELWGFTIEKRAVPEETLRKFVREFNERYPGKASLKYADPYPQERGE